MQCGLLLLPAPQPTPSSLHPRHAQAPLASALPSPRAVLEIFYGNEHALLLQCSLLPPMKACSSSFILPFLQSLTSLPPIYSPFSCVWLKILRCSLRTPSTPTGSKPYHPAWSFTRFLSCLGSFQLPQVPISASRTLFPCVECLPIPCLNVSLPSTLLQY